MKFIYVILLLLAITGASNLIAHGQASKQCQQNVFDYDSEDTLTLDAKALLEQPKCFDGKFVRVIGFYSYGFEMSSLFCPNCDQERAAWVNSDDYRAAIKRCTTPENFKKLGSKGSTLGIVALGIFRTRLNLETQQSPKDMDSRRLSDSIGGFGHMSSYDSEFSPICFEEVEQFSHYSIVDDEKTKKRMRVWYDKMIDRY